MNNIKPALILLFLVVGVEKTKAGLTQELLSEYTAAYFKFLAFVPTAAKVPTKMKLNAGNLCNIHDSVQKKIKDSLWEATVSVKKERGWPKSHVAISVDINEINGDPQFIEMYTGNNQRLAPTRTASTIIGEINFGLTEEEILAITEIAKIKGAKKLGCNRADIVLKTQPYEEQQEGGKDAIKKLFFIIAQNTESEAA